MILLLWLLGVGCSDISGFPSDSPAPFNSNDCFEVSQSRVDFGDLDIRDASAPRTVSIDVIQDLERCVSVPWELDDPDEAFEVSTSPENAFSSHTLEEYTIHLTLVADEPGVWEGQLVEMLPTDDGFVRGRFAIQLFGETFDSED